MTNKEKFALRMQEAGVCDQRGAAFCATAAGLPDGSFGLCLLGVNGNELSIYDTDMKSNVGEKLYTIPLHGVTNVQINVGFMAELMKGFSFRFVYNGFTYTFKNCAQNKMALNIIRQETGNGETFPH